MPMIIGGQLSPEDWAAIKQAKDELDLPFLVKPVQAVPGSPGRVLALGVLPGWVCDYYPVWKAQSPAIKDAIRWVLTGNDDPKAVTMEKALQNILGPDVKEVTNANDSDKPNSLNLDFGSRGQYDPNAGDGW